MRVHHERLVEGLVARRGALVERALLAHRLVHRVLHEPRGVDLVGAWAWVQFRR